MSAAEHDRPGMRATNVQRHLDRLPDSLPRAGRRCRGAVRSEVVLRQVALIDVTTAPGLQTCCHDASESAVRVADEPANTGGEASG
jgi:hypothetical protein